MGYHRPPPKSAPDFTNAFLVTFGIVVFIALFAIWAVWGMLAAAGLSWLANRLLDRSGARR